MIQIAALAAGLAAVWFALSPSAEPAIAATGAGAIFTTIVFAAFLRVGGAGLWRAAQGILLSASQLGAHLQGAARIAGAALLGPGSLRPALVRIRTRGGSEKAIAAFATAISATPGAVVVEAGEDSLLLHASHEDRIDARALSALEMRAIAAMDGGPR